MQEAVVSREEYDKLLCDYQYVCFQLAELQRALFGTKSERFHSLKETLSSWNCLPVGQGKRPTWKQHRKQSRLYPASVTG